MLTRRATECRSAAVPYVRGTRTGLLPTVRAEAVRTDTVRTETQGSLPRGRAPRHVRRTRTGPGRAVRTAYRGAAQAARTVHPCYLVITSGADDWGARKADLAVLFEGANRWTDNLSTRLCGRPPPRGVGPFAL